MRIGMAAMGRNTVAGRTFSDNRKRETKLFQRYNVPRDKCDDSGPLTKSVTDTENMTAKLTKVRINNNRFDIKLNLK